MKKRLSWKKISAIGAGAVMAMSLAFGMGFSNLFASPATEENTVDGNYTQNVEGGVLTER